ncbi:MAG: homocysteine S-methyltransferase family protein [Candidatus Omnitrophota bacterium]
MKPLIEQLNEKILVCDGAMGTQLISKGLPQGESPDYWAIKNSRILSGIHKAYLDAGADMITSNTFGANRIKLKRLKLQNKTEQINAQALKIARAACANSAYVLGDIGPTGEYLKPVGNLDFNDCYNAFLEQARIFESEGADAIIIETMTDIEELRAAVMAVKENIKLPLIACMSFGKTAKGAYRTTSGVSIPQMVQHTLTAGSDVIGSNCGVDIAGMIEIISEMRPLGTAFIIAQPNAGDPQLINGQTVYSQSAEVFARHLAQLIKAGPNIIGACCGSTPEHIKKIREAVEG